MNINNVNLVSKGYINSNVAYCGGGYGSSQVFLARRENQSTEKKKKKKQGRELSNQQTNIA